MKPIYKAPLLKKQALDALLEVINDPEYATHQHHSDPDFTTQTGKDYAGRGSTEVEDGVSVTIPPEAITAAIEPDQIDTDPDVEFHRQYDFMQMLKKTFRGWTGGNPFYHFQMPMNSVRLYSDGWKIQRFDKDTGVEGKTLEELKAYLAKADWVRNLKPTAPPYLERTIEGQTPSKKLTAATESFIGPHSAVDPTKTYNKNYIWVYHPSYGFYFAEGMEAEHIKLFKGIHASTSFPGAKIPKNLYDDCNRGYAWVKKSTKYISLTTSTVVEPEWDFIPQAVVKGFQKYFPGYTFDENILKSAATKQATTVRFIGPHSDVPIAESKARYYCWVYHPDYGFYYGEGSESDHWKFFKGEYEGAMIPRRSYDTALRGYAEINRTRKTVKLEISIAMSQWDNEVPAIALKVFQKELPDFKITVKKSLMGSVEEPIEDELQEHEFFKESDHLVPVEEELNGHKFFKEGDPEFEKTKEAAINDNFDALDIASLPVGERVSAGAVIAYVRALHEGYEDEGPEGEDRILQYDAFILKLVDINNIVAPWETGEQTVNDYAALPSEFPPIVLDAAGRVTDGTHRVAAAIQRGDKQIKAFVPTMNKIGAMSKGYRSTPEKEDISCTLEKFGYIYSGMYENGLHRWSKGKNEYIIYSPTKKSITHFLNSDVDLVCNTDDLEDKIAPYHNFERPAHQSIPITSSKSCVACECGGCVEHGDIPQCSGCNRAKKDCICDGCTCPENPRSVTAAVSKQERELRKKYRVGCRVRDIHTSVEGTIEAIGKYWREYEDIICIVEWDPSPYLHFTDTDIPYKRKWTEDMIVLDDQQELFTSENISRNAAVSKDEKRYKLFKEGGRVRFVYQGKTQNEEGTISHVGRYQPKYRGAVITVEWDQDYNLPDDISSRNLIPLGIQGELFSNKTAAMGKAEKHFLSFKPGDRVVFYKPYIGKHEGTVVSCSSQYYYRPKLKVGVVPVRWDYQTDKDIALPTSDTLIHLDAQGELFPQEKTSAIGKDERYIRDNFKVGGRVRYYESELEGTIESIWPYNPRYRSATIVVKWDDSDGNSFPSSRVLIPLNDQGELFPQEKTASSSLEAEAYIEWGGVYDHRHLELDEYKGTWEWTDYDASDVLNIGRQVGECKSLEEAKEKLERVVFNIGEPRTYIHYSDDEHIKKQDYLAPEEKGFLRDTGVGTDIKPDFSKDYSPYTRDKDFLNSMGIKARKKAQEILPPRSMCSIRNPRLQSGSIKNSPIHQYMRSLGQWYHVSGSLYRNVKHPEMVLSVFDDGWTIRQWGKNIDSGEDINTLKTYLASHDLDTNTSMKPSPNRHVDVSLGPNTIEGEGGIVPERKRLNAAANKKLFHVTHTDKVPSLYKKGIIPLQTSNWVKGGPEGERYGNGEIFAFSDPSDAVRWSGKMDWDFNQSMGTGKISIVAFIPGEEKWKTDTADPLSQASSKGKWLKATGWVKPEQITSVTAVTPEIIKSVIGGQIPKLANTFSEIKKLQRPARVEIKTSKTAQEQKTSTALEVTLLFKRWRVKSRKMWSDVLGMENEQIGVEFIPCIKKYSDRLRDLVHSNLVLFNGVPEFDLTLQALEIVQGNLDLLETVKMVKIDKIWTVRSAASQLDSAFRHALYAYDDADDFLSKNSSTKSYGIGTPIGGTPNEFRAVDNPDEDENDQMNITGGLSITASWDVLATNYFDMFQQVLALPESRGLDSSIKKEISWAKQTLKKADRIVWYLRWYRLNLESQLAGDSLRNATAKAIFKNDLGVYSRKNPITEADIPTSMTDLQNKLAHFLGLEDYAVQNKAWYFETPKQLVDDFKKLENDIRERLESERRTISEEDNDPEDEIFIGFPDGWAWWLLDRAYCSEEAKAMGHCGNSPRRGTGDRILSLRQPVMKGGNQYWSPHCTFILRSGKFLGEMKGRNNDKPVARYHPYIIALLKDPRIFGIMGGGYLPEHNFHWSDLSHKEQEEIKKTNPNFTEDSAKAWEAMGKGDKAVATIATALGLAEDDEDPSSFNRALDAFIVHKWSNVGKMIYAIGDNESINTYSLVKSSEENPYAFDDDTAPEDRINILIDKGLSPRALNIMAEKIKEEEPNELNRFIEIQKRLNPNFEFNLLDDSVLRDMLDYDRRIGGVIWPLVDMAFNMAGDKRYKERRISDLEYAITSDLYEQGDNDQANTVLRYGENADQSFSWDAGPVYELISYDDAVRLVSDPDIENKDLSNGQLHIQMMDDDGGWADESDNDQFYNDAAGALEKLLIKGSPRNYDRNQMTLEFKPRTPSWEGRDKKKYQRTTGGRKKSFVDIHETPTMLPPRDDMRRHLDTDEQDEAMHGVRDGIMDTDEPKLPKPKQIDPRIKGAALIPAEDRTIISSAGKTPRSKEEIINEIDYLYSIADHPEISREESERLLGEIKKLNREFEANGYKHDRVDAPLPAAFLDMVDDVRGNVTHEKTINPHDKKWLQSFGIEGSKQAAFNRKEAQWIRKSSGSKIDETLKKAVKILGENGIPTLVAGGYAVQEYGYPRYTKDIDIIVPDRIQSIQLLIENGFHKANTPNTVIDNETNEEVDLLLAGDRMNIGPVPFPTPSEITLVPKLITLEELIDLKLGSYASNPWGRTKDLADVTELIQRNSIPKEFMAKGLMNKAWNNLWDMMHQTPDNPIEPKESCFKVLSSVVEIENKIADDEDQLDSEGEYFLEQVNDAKEEAKRHFMNEDYIQQQAKEDGRTMEEMWDEIGEEFTANFYDYPYNPPKEKQKPIAIPEFSTGDREHLHGMGVLGSRCPLCKSANLKKVAGMNLTECIDCKGVYSISVS